MTVSMYIVCYIAGIVLTALGMACAEMDERTPTEVCIAGSIFWPIFLIILLIKLVIYILYLFIIGIISGYIWIADMISFFTGDIKERVKLDKETKDKR